MTRRNLLPWIPAVPLAVGLVAELASVRPAGAMVALLSFAQLLALTLAWALPLGLGLIGLVALLRCLCGGEERLVTRWTMLIVAIPGAFLFVTAGEAVLRWAGTAFNSPRLIAAVMPVALLAIAALLTLAAVVVWRLAGARLVRLRPSVRWGAIGALAAAALAIHLARFPELEDDAQFGALVELAAATALCAAALAVAARGRRVTLGKRALATWAGVAVAAWGLHLTLPRIGALRSQTSIATAGIQNRGLAAGPLGRITMRAAGDSDKDGFIAAPFGLDCDDHRAAVHPLAAEIVGNGVDEDCFEGDLGAEAAAADERARVAGYHAPGAPRTKNVILISMDALRHDAPGYAGAKHPSSPNLDAIAARAVVLCRAYAHAPSTRRSTPTLLSGRLPANVHWIRKPDLMLDCRDDNVFLAERLRAAGFATGSVVSYNYAKNARFDQGFDDRLVRRGEKTAPQIVNEAIALMRKWHAGGQRFFLWTHFYEPHHPYNKYPAAASFGDSAWDRYLGEVRSVDDQLARLFTTLDELGIAGETTIILTSDHGEEFGEHGGEFHLDLYEEDLRVPMFIAVPGASPRSIDAPVGLVDLAPTVLELAGVPVADPVALDGESLVPLMDGAAAKERWLIAELIPDKKVARRMEAWIGPRWKLITDLALGARELYDLEVDPGEKDNALAREPERAAALEEAMRRFASLRLRYGSIRD